MKLSRPTAQCKDCEKWLYDNYMHVLVIRYVSGYLIGCRNTTEAIFLTGAVIFLTGAPSYSLDPDGQP